MYNPLLIVAVLPILAVGWKTAEFVFPSFRKLNSNLGRR